MAKTIGVLVIDLEGEYSRLIWPSIAKTVQARGHDCIVLPANNPRYPYDYLYQFNMLFNYIDSKILDALILVPDTIMNFLTEEQALDMIDRIKAQVPVISMNHQIEDVPSMLVNFGQGIREGVDHLVNYHGYKRIAFIEGPRKNPESLERKKAFIDAMEQQGITVPEEWIYSGDFTRTTARRLTRQYGDYWVEHFDAVFTANDYTALAIMMVLKQMGYLIPEDLGVVGFDDINEAPYLNPPLTTVSQPFKDITAAAANTAADICEGKAVAPVTYFDTKLQIRSSCGCRYFMSDRVQKMWPRSDDVGGDFDMKSILPPGLPGDAVQRIIPKLEDIKSFFLSGMPSEEDVETLLHKIESVIDIELFEHGHMPDWAKMYIQFFHLCLVKNSKITQAWTDLGANKKILYLLSRKARVWEGYTELHREDDIMRPLWVIQDSLSRVNDIKYMTDMVNFLLDYLGIRNALFCLYTAGRHKRGLYSSLPGKSRAVLAVIDGERQEGIGVEDPIVFPTLDLWPAELKPTPAGRVWTAVPIFNNDASYGYAILEINNFNGFFAENLRQHISITTQRCYANADQAKAESKLQALLKEMEIHNRQLKQDSLADMLTGLFNRRGFVQEVGAILGMTADKHIRYCLYFSDMDGLKKINDELGHPEGDQAIRDMADILKDTFRQEDIIARLGGDEFTVFAEDVPENFHDIIEKRLAARMKEYRKKQARSYKLSISFGRVMGFTDDAGLNLYDLMKQADALLLEEKKKKRKREKIDDRHL